MTRRERIAKAVDNEEWQKFRLSLKGTSTQDKLARLREYFKSFEHGHSALGRPYYDSQGYKCLHNDCDACIRVDNYLKALARGGQLRKGVSLTNMVSSDWSHDWIIK